MIHGAITSNIDVAQVVLYAFFVFFACLIWYLRGEDRREGYPLESEAMGRQKQRGFLFIPKPKIFRLGHGVKVKAPRFDVDARTLNAVKVAPWPGAPLEPTGDPMLAAVGPGSYALRADVSEKTFDGRDLIVPLRVATNYAVASEGPNPIGMEVVGADGLVGGVVTDVWVDRSEQLLRYFEVSTTAGARRVLLPVPFANVKGSARQVVVEAILGSQFANAPTTKSPDQVTLLEEEKIVAYYGGGTLYASPERAEPLL
ncbi:MAG: photosynthetic reaction center subunit H [Roseiarcus sp.]|jgi:photosynthetic reaction center H subunit